MRRALRAAVTAAALAAVVGCSGGDDEVAATPSPEPEPTATETTPEPEPEPEPEPVEGEATVVRVDVASELGLGLPEQGPAADADVDAFAASLVELLDAHLDSARTGDASPLLDAALDGLLDEPATEALVADLADAEDLAVEASYVIEVNTAAVPEWAQVQVATTTDSGASVAATLLFAPTDDGPALVGVGEVDA